MGGDRRVVLGDDDTANTLGAGIGVDNVICLRHDIVSKLYLREQQATHRRTLFLDTLPLARLRPLCHSPANHSHEVLVLVSCEPGEVAKLMGTAELHRRLLGVFVDLVPSQQAPSFP